MKKLFIGPLLCIGLVLHAVVAAEQRMDLDTRVAHQKWQHGNLLTDNQIGKLLSYSGIPNKDSRGHIDLGMRVAVFKVEIGHPLSQKDWDWIARYGNRGNKIEAIEMAKRRDFLGLIPSRNDLKDLPVASLSRAPGAGLKTVVVAKVLQQNHSCIFQDESGAYYAIQYGGGIVFTNYVVGSQFWIDGGLRVGATLVRRAGDQRAKIITLKKVGG